MVLFGEWGNKRMEFMMCADDAWDRTEHTDIGI